MNDPVAWAAAANGGDYAVRLFFDEIGAQREVDRRTVAGLRSDYVVVPLYRHPQPTLTAAEREALEWAGGNDWWTDRNTPTGERHAATIRGLLERTKGASDAR